MRNKTAFMDSTINWHNIQSDIKAMILFHAVDSQSIVEIHRRISKYAIVCKEWREILKSRIVWTRLYQSLSLVLPNDWKDSQSLFETLINDTAYTEFIYWKRYRIIISESGDSPVIDNQGRRVATVTCDRMLFSRDHLTLIDGDRLIILCGDITARHEFAIEELSMAEQVSISFIDGSQAVVILIFKGKYAAYIVNISSHQTHSIVLPLSYKDIVGNVIGDFGIYSIEKDIMYPWKSILSSECESISVDIDAHVGDFPSTTPVFVVESGDEIIAYDANSIKELWSIDIDGSNINYDSLGDVFIVKDWKYLIDPMTGKVIYSIKEDQGTYINGITLKDDLSGYIVWLTMFSD